MTKHHPIIIAGVLGALALAPPAFAGQPPRSDLNPPPPDFYTCQATGPQTICRASLRFHEDPVITDVDCPGFPIVDQGDVATGVHPPLRRRTATSSSASSTRRGRTRSGATR